MTSSAAGRARPGHGRARRADRAASTSRRAGSPRSTTATARSPSPARTTPPAGWWRPASAATTRRAISCPAPAAHAAGSPGSVPAPSHPSVVELVNPDAGTAVADITVYGRQRRRRRTPAARRLGARRDQRPARPRRDRPAARRARARRGRHPRPDRRRRAGPGRPDRLASLTQDWLPGPGRAGHRQPAARARAPATGRRTLVLANGGDDEVRAELQDRQRRTRCSRRTGSPEIRVPPQSVGAGAPCPPVVGQAVAQGAIGLPGHVLRPGDGLAALRTCATTCRTRRRRAVRESTATLLPPGRRRGSEALRKQLVAAPAPRPRPAPSTVVALDGRRHAARRTTEVEVAPDRAPPCACRPPTRLLSVTPARTTVVGAVVVTGAPAGASVLPADGPGHATAWCRDVRPGLP